MKRLQFWIEYGSTYTYLSVARITRMAEVRGVDVQWQPFFLMPILIDHGMPSGPFLAHPSKLDYMWRDLERRAGQVGVQYRRPSAYPVNSLSTARIACIAAREGWCQGFTEKVFSLHWTEDLPIGTDDNLDTALCSLGRDPADLKVRAQSADVKDELRQRTEHARALKIFGAPSFVVGSELFWGDDRLEAALDWAARA